MTVNVTTRELIWRRRQQFLIHSYIYYILNDNIISDEMFDRICVELYHLQQDYPDVAESLPYHDICSQIDDTASGSFIRDYPVAIVSKALYLVRIRR